VAIGAHAQVRKVERGVDRVRVSERGRAIFDVTRLITKEAAGLSPQLRSRNRQPANVLFPCVRAQPWLTEGEPA
jgi:hypothetical protein